MIRLVINGFEVNLRDDIDIDLSLTIADGTKPLQRQRTGSEPIRFADTANNRQFFYTTYALSLDSNNFTATFNPAQRVEAKAYDGEYLVFDGLFQITKIRKIGDSIIPEGVLYSNFLGIYERLGDLEVASLGWDEYNHALTTENIVKSWFQDVVVNGVRTANFDNPSDRAPVPKAFGYFYPIVDWGLAFNRATPDTHFNSSDANSPKWRHNELYPCVYAQEVLKKIFEFTNVSVVDEANSFYSDANGVDTLAMRRRKPLTWLVLAPEGGDYPRLTSAEVNQRSVTLTTGVGAGSGYSITEPYNVIEERVFFDIPTNTFSTRGKISTQNRQRDLLKGLSTTSTTDALGQFSATLGKITVSRGGRYKLSIDGGARMILRTVHSGTNYDLKGFQEINLFAVSGNKRKTIGSVGGTYQFTVTNTSNTTSNFTFLEADGFSLEIQEGEEITIMAEFKAEFDYSYQGTNLALNVTATIENFGSNVIKLISNDGTLETGDTVTLSKFIPKMRCADFLSGIIKMYNLYVSDVTEDGKIFMNTLENMDSSRVTAKSFYKPKEQGIDWSRKIDTSKEIEIVPMPVNKAKNYIFRFKPTVDYFSDLYFSATKKQWGARTYEVPSTFQKGDEIIELPFSTTPPIQVGKGTPATNQVTIPRIVKFDELNQLARPSVGSAKLYYITEMLRVGTGTEEINIETTDGATRTAFNYYRSLSNLSPIVVLGGGFRMDLLFQTPDILYYDLSTMRRASNCVFSPMSSTIVAASSIYATVNTFDFHRRPLLEITNSDSKLVKAYFNLTEKDLSELDFSKFVLIDGTYYRLAKVEYRVGSNESSYCELMKVLNFPISSLLNTTPPPA